MVTLSCLRKPAGCGCSCAGISTRACRSTRPFPAASANIRKQLKVYPLSAKDSPPKMEFINVSGKKMNTVLPNDYSFFEKLHDLIQGEPHDYLGPEAKGMMAAIGIEKGKPFNPDERMKKILTDAAAIGNAAARAISFFPREPGNLIYGEDSAWMMAYANKDTAFEKDGAFNLDARALFHFGYICVSPAMAVTVAGKGSDYGLIALDSKKRPLDGSKTYKLHLPPNPPVKDFWALTMYDTQTRSQLQTDQQFPTLGSQTEGVEKNADGSYDIYFAPKAAPGQGRQLAADCSRQELVACPADVRPTAALDRPDLAAGRDRIGSVGIIETGAFASPPKHKRRKENTMRSKSPILLMLVGLITAGFR